MFFINHALKFEYQPSCLKVKQGKNYVPLRTEALYHVKLQKYRATYTNATYNFSNIW